MKRSLLILSLLASALSSACLVPGYSDVPGFDRPPSVRLTGGAAWSSLDGNVAATDLDAVGELVGSSLDELGVGARQSVAQVGLRLTEGDVRWDIFAQRTGYSGSGVLADDLTMEGVELRFDEGDVSTDLELGLYGFRWLKHVSSDGQLKVNLGASLVLAELDLDFEQQIVDPGTGDLTGEVKSTGRDVLLPIPLPALDLVYDHEDFDAHFLLSGMKVWAHEASGHVIELDFHVSIPVLDDLGELVLGYRELELELEHSGDDERAEIDVSLNGPYLAYRVSF
jgi:hypothetical protein